jgi:alanine racemase
LSKTSSSAILGASAFLSWVEVDLSAIRYNYRQIRQHLDPAVALFPVVKADAYGHGAIAVVKILQDEGARRVCVARVEEAAELREAGIRTDILVFTPPLAGQAAVAAQYRLEMVVCDRAHIQAVLAAQKASSVTIPVHIKTDVGMGRIGAAPGDVPALLKHCQEQGLTVSGIMSHFPCADVEEPNPTLQMAETFRSLYENLADQVTNNEIYFHISNTAAMFRYPRTWFNAVRSGISLYGQYPSGSMEKPLLLRPAMSLKTRIVYIKDVPADTPISYCQTWRTPRPSRIATLALGYADGYPRHASNVTELLVRGKRAPQVGRVCMDQLMIDVTDIPGTSIGDEVLAFGSSPGGILPAEEVAESFGSLGYELTSRIGKRLPRFFVENDLKLSESNQPPR